MGRRKERRHAGHGGAGRRVKLDLFAEPSGDMDGSSSREEVRGEGDSKNDAALSNSPSSSDNRPHNPLLLLEQYSDDELDEGSGEEHNCATTEATSADGDHQAKRTIAKEENISNDTGTDHFTQKDDQILINKGFASPDSSQKLEVGGHLANASNHLLGGTDTFEGVTYSAASNTQLLGDLSSDWKMVLHEESNQYYYWNVTTGETSWEVPEILATGTSTTVADKAGVDIDGKNDAFPNASKANTPVGTEVDLELSCGASGGEETKMVVCNDVLPLDDGDGNREANDGQGTLAVDASINNTRLDLAHGTTTDLSTKLVNHCESMLERLNSVKSMECDVEGQYLKLKCRIELEIRLADMKALASHGSSVLPFWLHQEDQLKQLEATVDDVVLRYLSLSTGEIEASPSHQEGVSDGIEIDSRRNEVLFPVVEIHSPEQMVGKSSPVSQNGVTRTSEPVGLYLPTSSVNNMEGITEISSVETKSESIIKSDTHSGDDIDMDVDMEVEEDISTSISGAHFQVFPGHYYQSNALGNQETEQVCNVLPQMEHWVPPPPPDDEPLPPPPPDDEPFPPPPPDEPPPGTSYSLVSQPESVQPYPYSEHYTMSYPEYYGQIQADGTALYMHADGSQVALAHLPHCYAVANAYTVKPFGVNPLEPSSYYGLHAETLNALPLAGESVKSSLATISPVSGNRELDVLKSSEAIVEPLLAMNTVPASSSSDTTTSVAATAATSKSKSKASLGKKRSAALVSILRPNKKVSNLVDKWKAVKEGLHEEEEEPEDAYEILERKKKREIEEWRARQLATGEAKANANFQPLGGDWRERVKRKRAQKMKESRQNSPDVSKDGNEQPDIVELSKGLPSGWQAYWDESSKQVYYGNTLTSETSWSKPK